MTTTVGVGVRLGGCGPLRDVQASVPPVIPAATSRAASATVKRFQRDGRGSLLPPHKKVERWEQACRQSWRALALVIKAKLEALFRRKSTDKFENTDIGIGAAKFDAERAILLAHGKEIELNPKEAGILKLLLLKRGAPVSRDRLLASVWGYENLPNTRTVDNYVMSLRRKLELAAGPKVSIMTKRSVGYLLVQEGDAQVVDA